MSTSSLPSVMKLGILLTGATLLLSSGLAQAAIVPVPPARDGFGCYEPSALGFDAQGVCIDSTDETCRFFRAIGLCSWWADTEEGCKEKCDLCGNNVVDLDKGESCDDGNQVDGDGCDSACQLEDIYCCFGGTRLVMTADDAKTNFDNYFGGISPGVTGNECSDLNAMADVGSKTELDSGIPCECGNGTIDTDEECDLGRAEDGTNRNREEYGCDNQCKFLCGNGMTNNGDGPDTPEAYVVDKAGTDWVYGGPFGIRYEQCDDGNRENGDACDQDCQLCGNGQLDSGEECDLGRSADGSSRNIDEYGCTDECKFKCGNGVTDEATYVVDDGGIDWAYTTDGIATEQCDDANLDNNDGCDSNCQEEVGACCDVGGYDPPYQALKKTDCDNGDGTYNSPETVGVAIVTQDDAKKFCNEPTPDQWCCSEDDGTGNFPPKKLSGEDISTNDWKSCSDAKAGGEDVYDSDFMNEPTANKACVAVYCQSQNCEETPKFICQVGYDRGWTPPPNSEHKADIERCYGGAVDAKSFCDYWNETNQACVDQPPVNP